MFLYYTKPKPLDLFVDKFKGSEISSISPYLINNFLNIFSFASNTKFLTTNLPFLS